MIDAFGKVRCNDCGMDLAAYPSDYEDGGLVTFCGHCQNERHVCPPDPFAAREDGLKPFTVVRDWDSDWWEKECDDIRCTDDPQVFHVWADSGSDASDEAMREAEERFGETAASFLSAVAVLRGHAPFAED
ncbi:hypothetical protein AB0F36_07980 [Streptomyces sp. NPDC029080]|uniref:hypothetical protein n=1 Tax=Streptomyces sp. NPDC029080 TaxID=3155017 RepID=UPI003403EAB4